MAHSLAEFAADIARMEVAFRLLGEDAMERACRIVEDESKRVIGTYDYAWPQLKPSTQAERVSRGFSANDPLLRTGDMRDSISHTVVVLGFAEDIVGYVGSNSMIAVYQELGTNKIPPRSFLGGAARAKEHEVAEEIGGGVRQVLLRGLTP